MKRFVLFSPVYKQKLIISIFLFTVIHEKINFFRQYFCFIFWILVNCLLYSFLKDNSFLFNYFLFFWLYSIFLLFICHLLIEFLFFLSLYIFFLYSHSRISVFLLFVAFHLLIHFFLYFSFSFFNDIFLSFSFFTSILPFFAFSIIHVSYLLTFPLISYARSVFLFTSSS